MIRGHSAEEGGLGRPRRGRASRVEARAWVLVAELLRGAPLVTSDGTTGRPLGGVEEVMIATQ